MDRYLDPMKIITLLLSTALVTNALFGNISASITNRDVRPATLEYLGESLSLDQWTVFGPLNSQLPDDGRAIRTAFWESTHSDLIVSPLPASMLADHSTTYVVVGPTSHSMQSTELDTFLDFRNLFGQSYAANADKSSRVIVTCAIDSSSARNAYLIVRSAETASIWLNGVFVTRDSSSHGLNRYSLSAELPLIQGHNILLIDINRGTHFTWGIAARLEPSPEQAAKFAFAILRSHEAELLDKCIVQPSASILICPPGVPREVRFALSISSLSGVLISHFPSFTSGTPWTPPSGLPQGLYKATISFQGHSHDQTFCIGSPNDLVVAIAKRLESITNLSHEESVDLGTLQRRLEAIQSARDNKEKGNWEGKMVHGMAEYDTFVTRLQLGREAVKELPGLYLRGFESRIDGAPQDYRLFVPSSYRRDSDGMKLVVMLPTASGNTRPFFRSAFLAYQNEADQLCHIAEANGVALLWCGYRNEPSGAPCEPTHVLEAIAAVEDDYSVDRARISLLGECTGGAIAMQTVLRYPHLFAAVALLNPQFTLHHSNSFGQTLFARIPAYYGWMDSGNLANSFLNTSNVPTYIIHDGSEKGHGDLSFSEAFAKEASMAGFQLQFEKEVQPFDKHFAAWANLISWLGSQRRGDRTIIDNPINAPPSSALQRVADAFADKFVVVKGTGGEGPEHDAIERIAADFQRTWIAVHFNPCRIVTDQEYDPNKEERSSLVLIGNSRTNAVWRTVVSRLPITTELTRIRINDREWTGSHLAFEVGLPRPDVDDRQIILIGSERLQDAHFSFLALSVEGWFNYSIWNVEPSDTQLLAAGVW